MGSRVIKRNGMWHVRLQRGGWDTLVPCGCGTRRQAETSAARIIAEANLEKRARALARKICQYALELARGESKLDEIRSPLAALEKVEYERCLDIFREIFPLPAITASDVWRAYESCPDPDRAKPRTLAARAYHFSAFARWAGSRDLRDMSVAKCRQALDGLDVHGQTRNNYISDLSVVFDRAGVAAPWRDLRSPVEHKESSPADIGMLRRFLDFCDRSPSKSLWGVSYSTIAAALRVMYYTGLRPSDAAALERSEVHDGLVELRPEKTTRTRKKVSFRAHEALLDVLDSLPDDGSGHYFPELLKGGAWKRLTALLKRLFSEAGLPQDAFLPSGLRHYFATTMIDRGVDSEDLAAAVGHVSTGTTREHYYHGRRAVDLPPLPTV